MDCGQRVRTLVALYSGYTHVYSSTAYSTNFNIRLHQHTNIDDAFIIMTAASLRISTQYILNNNNSSQKLHSTAKDKLRFTYLLSAVICFQSIVNKAAMVVELPLS